MVDQLTLIFGTKVVSSDGHCGSLGWVVIDPVKRVATDLVVLDHLHNARYVDIGGVVSAGDEIVLNVNKATFEKFEAAERAETVLTNPPGAIGMGMGRAPVKTILVHDIPPDEQEVDADEDVEAADGKIGHLRGMVVEVGGGITQILIRAGRVGHRSNVSIPIDKVRDIDNVGVKLTLTKKDVHAIAQLPSA